LFFLSFSGEYKETAKVNRSPFGVEVYLEEKRNHYSMEERQRDKKVTEEDVPV
jgi:hypothetical protein